MLQKLENIYLAILRFVVLLVAGLLLIGVVILGFNALKVVSHEPAPLKAEPKVTAEEIIRDISPSTVPGSPAKPARKPGASQAESDPLQPYFKRMAVAINTFIAKTAPHLGPLHQANLEEVLRNRAKAVKNAEQEPAFVQGMMDTLEKVLNSPEAAKAVKTSHPFDFINEVLDRYAERFNQQLDAVAAENAEKIQQYQQQKAEGMQSLYAAGAAFASFLLIVFLSIIIRIERNLRNLERLPTPPAQQQPPTPSAAPLAVAEGSSQV